METFFNVMKLVFATTEESGLIKFAIALGITSVVMNIFVKVTKLIRTTPYQPNTDETYYTPRPLTPPTIWHDELGENEFDDDWEPTPNPYTTEPLEGV